MKDVVDQNPFTVKAEDGGAMTEDGDIGVIAHANIETGDRVEW